MTDLINREIDKLILNIPKLSNIKAFYLFSTICLQYFYNNGKVSYHDFRDCFVDGRGDGGIDLVKLFEDPNDQLYLVLIQSKAISKLANSQDIIDILKRMDQTIRDFRDYRTAKYNPRLKRILKDKLSIANDQSSVIELSVFLGCDISAKLKDEINKSYENIEELNNYQISIYDKSQIEEQIKNILEPRKFVPEGKVKFALENGSISYHENGLIANVYANSLKDLYDRFKDRGLFEQNFRYYIGNKRIDDNINTSLKKKRELFWFLNNGIIIGCKDFRQDGNTIRLYDFSIINGCQTATLLGEYKGSNEGEDFVISCKVVKPEKGSSEDDFLNNAYCLCSDDYGII